MTAERHQPSNRAGALPPLVIVAGAPGAGKTTLARRLAADLCLPLLAKDGIKEILGDALGAADLAGSEALGAATYKLLYAVAGWLLEGRSGVVLESNFHRGHAEASLLPLLRRATGVLVQCEAPAEVILRRYVDRARRGERHPVHFDRAVLPRLREGLDTGLFGLLDLPVPRVPVDTASGYAPDYEAVLAAVEVAIRGAAERSP